MQNVQNLLCFLDKSPKNILIKKEERQKVLAELVKYISVDPKEPFTDI